MQQQRLRNRMILGLLALGLLALTASPAQSVSGPGPYYAEPAWDQIKGARRFLVLTNWNSEAVLDKETGLVWEKTPTAVATTWLDPFSARFLCADKTVGGRKGWRLPSLPELTSLIDPTQTNPALPPGHPFTNVQLAVYWSATTSVESPSAAWVVDVNDGSVGNALRTDSLQVWCVRGGMNADAY